MKRQVVLILFGVALALLLWRLPAGNRTGSNPRPAVAQLPVQAGVVKTGNVERATLTTIDTNSPGIPVGARSPGTQAVIPKRPWDVAFFSKLGPAKARDPIRFE